MTVAANDPLTPRRLRHTIGAALAALGLVMVLGVVGASGLVGSEPHEGVRTAGATTLVAAIVICTARAGAATPRRRALPGVLQPAALHVVDLCRAPLHPPASWRRGPPALRT